MSLFFCILLRDGLGDWIGGYDGGTSLRETGRGIKEEERRLKGTDRMGER